MRDISLFSLLVPIILLFSVTANADPSPCLNGCPRNTSPNLIIDHDIYVVSINPYTKFADWVAYVVNRSNFLNGPKRSRNWRSDEAIPVAYRLIRVCPGTRNKACDDYKNAYDTYSYQRGHFVPLGTFKKHIKWALTNYYSNISPQKENLNNGAWKRLEERIRELAEHNNQNYYVLTGSLYDGPSMPLLPNAHLDHQVPSGYWKIVATYSDQTFKLAAFIFGQDALSRNFCDYNEKLSSVAKRSHLNFFPNNHQTIDSLLPDLGCS